MAAKQRELFDRERQLEIEQEALDAAIEACCYDGGALMHRVYYETPKAAYLTRHDLKPTAGSQGCLRPRCAFNTVLPCHGERERAL